MKIRPIITEKSMMLAQKGWYTFAVPAFARKEHISKEIGLLYSVVISDIRTIRRTGKLHRSGRKSTMVRRPDWKRAMVKLIKGQRIPVFDIGQESPKSSS